MEGRCEQDLQMSAWDTEIPLDTLQLREESRERLGVGPRDPLQPLLSPIEDKARRAPDLYE